MNLLHFACCITVGIGGKVFVYCLKSAIILSKSQSFKEFDNASFVVCSCRGTAAAATDFILESFILASHVILSTVSALSNLVDVVVGLEQALLFGVTLSSWC